MPRHAGAGLKPYGVAAVVVVAVAIALRPSLDPILGTRFPFATVFFAVLVSAWVGGFGPALLATAIGGVGSLYFPVEPRHRLWPDDAEGVGGLFLYLAISVGIALIGRGMRGEACRTSSRRPTHRQT